MSRKRRKRRKSKICRFFICKLKNLVNSFLLLKCAALCFPLLFAFIRRGLQQSQPGSGRSQSQLCSAAWPSVLRSGREGEKRGARIFWCSTFFPPCTFKGF